MSKHSSPALTMRDALYEAPGPKMRAKIRIGTAISLVAVAALVALVLQRFYVTGQLSVHYWYFFTHLTTWKFLLAGFEGTVKVALTAGAIALVLGLALMLGRTSDIKPLQLVCRVLTDFFRGVPSLLFIYFFFLVLPQYKIALPSFWMLTLPVALAYLPRSSVPASTPCRAVRSRPPRHSVSPRLKSPLKSCCRRRFALSFRR